MRLPLLAAALAALISAGQSALLADHTARTLLAPLERISHLLADALPGR